MGAASTHVPSYKRPMEHTTETADEAPAAQRRATRSIEIGWELRWGLWAIVVLTVLQTFIAKPFYIPSSSMTPTLIVGDRIIVDKSAYGWSWVSPVPSLLPEIDGRLLGRLPARGDVVVVRAPRRDADFIKRVIGLPGDTVELRRGAVILNGTPLPRHAAGTTHLPVDANLTCREGLQRGHAVRTPAGRTECRLPVVRETLPGGPTYDTVDLGYDPRVDDMARITVPAGRVFLMGDNRDQSGDSRVSLENGGLGGPVPVGNLVGRAAVLSFSVDGSTVAVAPSTWLSALREGRSWRRIGGG